MSTSLVPPLAAAPAGERASQVLPSVACSTCKAQVSMMDLGTHVCSLTPASSSRVAPPPRLSSAAAPSMKKGPPLPHQRQSKPPTRPEQQHQPSAPPFATQQQRRPSDPTPFAATAALPPRRPSISPTTTTAVTSSNSPLAQSASGRSPVLTTATPQQQQQQGGRRPPVAQPSVPRPSLSRRGTEDDQPLQPPPNVFAPGSRRTGSTSSIGSTQSASSSASSSRPQGSRPPQRHPTGMPLPPPGISHPSVNDMPLPSPPLNPWQLRPSSPALSSTSSMSAGYNPAPSSFHTPTLSYSHERSTKTPSPIGLDGVSEEEAWRIMREAESGGGAGRAGVGRRAFQLAAAQVMKERQVIGAFGGLKVETMRPPTMPASTSPSTYSPHSPFSTAAPSPAFQLETNSPSSVGSPNAPGSVFSHAPSHSTSTSLSSGHRAQQSIKERPSFETSLERSLTAGTTASAVTGSEAEGSEGESRSGGEGLGENFLNLGNMSDDSSDLEDDMRGQPPWKSAAGSDSSSLRGGLLKAIQQGSASKLPFPGNTSRPASPPSSRDTHSSGDHRRQASATTDSHETSADNSIRFDGMPSTGVKRPPPLAVESLMTPSSSMDHLAAEDIPRRHLPVPPSSAESQSQGPRTAGSSDGIEDLESMVDAMRQALTVTSPSSDSLPTTSPVSPPSAESAFPGSRLVSASHQRTAPLASKQPKRRKTCLRCACEVGGPTGKRFVAVKPDEEDAMAATAKDGSVSVEAPRKPSKGASALLCEGCWKELYLPKCRRCSLVIESEAVASSDGQLRGKWHRHCFTCFCCDKPFDGQTFYVHADRPHCELCYHRENKTLCQTCDLPIEGACAVIKTSTRGELRLHPTCLRCDHPFCSASMTEHYDLADGRRMCTDHAIVAWAAQQEQASRLAADGPRGLTVPLLDKPRKRMTLIVELP